VRPRPRRRSAGDDAWHGERFDLQVGTCRGDGSSGSSREARGTAPTSLSWGVARSRSLARMGPQPARQIRIRCLRALLPRRFHLAAAGREKPRVSRAPPTPRTR
jgi:hypothetical protein